MTASRNVKESCDLEELPLQILKRFGFDPTGDDTCEAQEAKDGGHVCTLSKQLFDGRDLPIHIIGGKKVYSGGSSTVTVRSRECQRTLLYLKRLVEDLRSCLRHKYLRKASVCAGY